jgi:hypothetical protein
MVCKTAGIALRSPVCVRRTVSVGLVPVVAVVNNMTIRVETQRGHP